MSRKILHDAALETSQRLSDIQNEALYRQSFFLPTVCIHDKIQTVLLPQIRYAEGNCADERMFRGNDEKG